MSLILMGYMGSGKTSHCRRLANRLSLPKFDLDVEIEKLAKVSVSEIFAQSGEEVFRELEARMLKKMLTQGPMVLALGGGTPCFNDNIEIIKQNTFSVYLKMDPAVAFKRLKFAKIGRPLLEEKGNDELEKYIFAQLAEREPFYSQANMTVDADKINAAKLDEIKGKYFAWQELQLQLK